MFLKLLKSKVIVGFMLSLLDVLAPLRHLSLNLQDRTALISCQHDSLKKRFRSAKQGLFLCSFSVITDIVNSLIQSQKLMLMNFSDGPNLRKLHDKYEGKKLCNTGFQHFSQIKIA